MNHNKHARALKGDGSDLPARQKYTKHDGDVHAQKVRLAKRAAIGADWDGKAANDNISWPLATALIREGNTELLKAAMAYRRIHDQAYSGATLGGTGVAMRDGFALDRHIHIRPNGTIAYKHIRQRTAAEVDIPARQYVPPFDDDETQQQHNSVKVPKAWSGDAPVNNKLDAQSRLVALRRNLGVLAEPLEMAVIDGATYRAIGNAAGVANKAGAEGAGRALVHTALLAVRDALGNIRRKDLAA